MWLKIHLSDFAAAEAQSFQMSKSFLRKQKDRGCEDRLQSAWFISSSCSCSSHLWLSGSGTAMPPCCSVSWAGWLGLMPHTGWLWLLWSEDPHVQCTAVYHWCTVALFTQRQVQSSNVSVVLLVSSVSCHPRPIPYEVVSVYFLIMIKIVELWTSALDSSQPKMRHMYK